MADRYSNLAYDLSRYEDRAERAKQRENIKTRKAPKPSETPAAIVTVILIGALGAMLAGLVSSKADIASVHAQIVAQEAEVQSLEQENTRMKTELEQKSSQKAVETYAEEILGMQKLEQSQREYISLESGNVVEIPEREENIFTKIKNSFDKFVEYIRG